MVVVVVFSNGETQVCRKARVKGMMCGEGGAAGDAKGGGDGGGVSGGGVGGGGGGQDNNYQNQ